MPKAFVNGTPAIIYDYVSDENGYMYCDCFYPSLKIKLRVPAILVEVRRDDENEV